MLARQTLPVALAVALLPLASSSHAVAGPPASGAPVASAPAAVHDQAPVAAGRALHLHGVTSSFEVSASDDGKLDVRAVVREGDASRVRVVTREEEGSVAVCVMLADESPDGCHVSGVHRGSHSSHDRNERLPRVDLVARVPRGVRLDATTVAGGIRAEGLTADVRATTVNGDVAVSTSGVAEVTTVNGAINATFGAAPREPVAFTTTSGPVSITFPRDVDADVEASTITGGIHAAFPLDVHGVPGGAGPTSAHARLGKGGARVSVTTVNGSIDLRVR